MCLKEVWNSVKKCTQILLKTKIYIYFKDFFIYYLAKYQAGYPVSGDIIDRLSGQISIRYQPFSCFSSFYHLFLLFVSKMIINP